MSERVHFYGAAPMDKLFGLPAHPFLVHIPIVLLPLSAIGVAAMTSRRSWYLSYRWVVLAIGIVGAAGAVLAASAGERLEGRIEAIEGDQAAAGWEHHAQLGETARNVALLYVALLAAYVVVPWVAARRRADTPRAQPVTRWLTPTLAVFALLGAAGSVVTIVQAGHTGSGAVWSEVVDSTGGGG